MLDLTLEIQDHSALERLYSFTLETILRFSDRKRFQAILIGYKFIVIGYNWILTGNHIVMDNLGSLFVD